MKVRIIFDKETIDDKYSCGWGLSYLINDKTLFDTGEKSEYTLRNLEALGINIEGIERVVISHNHWDHTGGLWDLLDINKDLEIFACSDFKREFKDKLSSYNFKLVNGFLEICENIYTTGPFTVRYKDKELEEQALLLNTDKGISIVCGCSHPGVLKFVEKAKEMFPEVNIYSVFGGFHLIGKDNRMVKYIIDEMKKLGIENVGPAHCTGFEAANAFKKIYPENFWDIKVGTEINL